MAKYQVQRRGECTTWSDGDVTYSWQDIVSDSEANRFGPASKDRALSKLARIRRDYPDEVYRVVKLIKEQ